MKKDSTTYEPHLALEEACLPPGEEWVPGKGVWVLIQVSSGSGYSLQPQLKRGLEAGMVLLVTPDFQGAFRASQLGELRLNFIPVEPERLII